jgi:hypothetical protein
MSGITKSRDSNDKQIQRFGSYKAKEPKQDSKNMRETAQRSVCLQILCIHINIKRTYILLIILLIRNLFFFVFQSWSH